MHTHRSNAQDSQPVTLRVLTYNVHRCIGTDRKLDVARVAEVIASCNADIIALQELDVGRARTRNRDQAGDIARHLQMTSHFHPALHVEEEKYGDAILSAWPSRLIRSDALPSIGEPRGAIWVEVLVAGQPINVVNTHLGLRRRERIAQMTELLGEGWLGNAACALAPTIFLGDFNAVPRSSVFRQLKSTLETEVGGGRRMRPTFPSRFPLLRLDHIFHNGKAELTGIEPVTSRFATLASDHLPLLATFKISVPARRSRTPKTASQP